MKIILSAEARKKLFIKISYILESIIGFVILLEVLLGTIDLIRNVYIEYIVKYHNPVSPIQFEKFLGHALLLVIGVELVIMLTLHTPGSIIEALLFAIARKIILVPKTNGMVDVVLGIIAIAGLFAIKKYLVEAADKDRRAKDKILGCD